MSSEIAKECMSQRQRTRVSRFGAKQTRARANTDRRQDHNLSAAPDRKQAPEPRCSPAKEPPSRRSDRLSVSRVRGRGTPRESQCARQTLQSVHPGNIRARAALLQHEPRKRRVRVGVNPLHDGLQEQFDNEVHGLGIRMGFSRDCQRRHGSLERYRLTTFHRRSGSGII